MVIPARLTMLTSAAGGSEQEFRRSCAAEFDLRVWIIAERPKGRKERPSYHSRKIEFSIRAKVLSISTAQWVVGRFSSGNSAAASLMPARHLVDLIYHEG
jgi:hypothetical protein